MSVAPDRYAVIGNPIGHSKSPDIHARFAEQTGQALTYEPVLAPLGEFARTLEDLRSKGFKGANVTVPFKLDAFALCDQRTPRAQAAGAVNTLSFAGATLQGDNTDGVGLVTDIVRNAGVAVEGRRILLLGAGGAARGVMLPLLSQNPAQLVIANRTRAKAERLAHEFGRPGVVSCAEFDALSGAFDIVINATSTGLSDAMPPLPPSVFATHALAYDMMYAKQPTLFLRFAAENGASTRDGLGMLLEQAAESFYVWRGVRPDTGPVYAELRERLQRQ